VPWCNSHWKFSHFYFSAFKKPVLRYESLIDGFLKQLVFSRHRTKISTEPEVFMMSPAFVIPAPTVAQVVSLAPIAGPLLCPKCLGSMRIISFIEDSDTVKKILKSASGSVANRHREPMIRRLKHLSYMMSSHCLGPMTTSSMLLIPLTCRGVVRRTEKETYL
jgi:hypothetical protein